VQIAISENGQIIAILQIAINENSQIIAILQIKKISLYMEFFAIYKNGKIIAIWQIAIYKNGQIIAILQIAIYKNGQIICNNIKYQYQWKFYFRIYDHDPCLHIHD
jgi:hypothetical protein